MRETDKKGAIMNKFRNFWNFFFLLLDFKIKLYVWHRQQDKT